MTPKPFLYTADMPLSEVITKDYELLLVITRFGISLGFGERTVQEVCDLHQVDVDTLLAVINTVSGQATYDSCVEEVFDKLDPHALIEYLRSSHHYFLEYKLPLIREHLQHALDEGPKDIAVVVMRFFDEYVNEVHKHMGYENEQVFPYAEKLLAGGDTAKYNIDIYSQHHDPVEAKITELKNILIKYYPDGKGYKMTTVLWDIFATEEDLALHNRVENHLLIPLVKSIEKKNNPLSCSQKDKKSTTKRKPTIK
ncbi:hemerythrin HHE cation binding domain protein [Bacteroidales bacterium KA00251]|nr:hemerythrin HHE cation binding domain protein [Bacteroidales bacterium KA00251]